MCPRSHLLRTESDLGGICLETLFQQARSSETSFRPKTEPQIVLRGVPGKGQREGQQCSAHCTLCQGL